jgi:hypothetical protein
MCFWRKARKKKKGYLFGFNSSASSPWSPSNLKKKKLTISKPSRYKKRYAMTLIKL